MAVQDLKTFSLPVKQGASPAKRRCLSNNGKLLSFDVEDETGILRILLFGDMVDKWQQVIISGNLLHIEDGLLQASTFERTIGRIELKIMHYSKVVL